MKKKNLLLVDFGVEQYKLKRAIKEYEDACKKSMEKDEAEGNIFSGATGFYCNESPIIREEILPSAEGEEQYAVEIPLENEQLFMGIADRKDLEQKYIEKIQAELEADTK